MSKRIRQLEDALQVEYGSRSTEQHPLLVDELLAIKKGVDHKSGPERAAESDLDAAAELGDGNLAGAMGLLTISEAGTARYVGATGFEVSNYTLSEQHQRPFSSTLIMLSASAVDGMFRFFSCY